MYVVSLLNQLIPDIYYINKAQNGNFRNANHV